MLRHRSRAGIRARRETTPLCTLPAGHSVYALSVGCRGDETVIGGTKGGRLLAIDRRGPECSGGSATVHEFVQGAPVLSVCALGAGCVVASDVAGRCCLWNTRAESKPVFLPAENHVVCALLRLDQDTLVGLSTTGAVLFWSLANNSLIKTVAIPPPPPWAALTPLLHWRSAEALAYPNSDGDLVVYRIGTGDVLSLAAHKGTFHTIVEFEDDLITVGRCDGRMKRWRAGQEAPSMTVAAPQGVISGAVLGDLEPQLLLIQEDGGAGLYLFGEQELELERSLPGNDFRAAVGPSWELLNAALQQRRSSEARRLAVRIQSTFECDATHSDEEGHAALERLGYEHVSLALRGRQASRRDDLVEELKAYHQLIRLLPADESASLPSLKRYVALLERAWQLEEAQRVLRQAVSLDVGLTEQLDRLAPYAEAMSSGCAVIEPDTPIATVLECAGVIGHGVSGLLRVHELEPLSCQGVTMSAQQIAKKYELAPQ